MRIRTLFIIWAFTAMLSAFASNAAENRPNTQETADDHIVASFDRELNREAPQPDTTTADDVDNDVLYERIAMPLQSPESNTTRNQEDRS